MPIQKDIESLDASIQERVKKCLSEMRADATIRSLGYVYIILLETKRELAVQMAYAAKARIRALPNDPYNDLQWVQVFFKKAGLTWKPTEDENKRPSTWTLDSKHVDGLAFDAAPSKDGKKEDWHAPDIVWERMAIIAEGHGFKSGRRWKNKDSPHFEA